jgi:hypothetical protein
MRKSVNDHHLLRQVRSLEARNTAFTLFTSLAKKERLTSKERKIFMTACIQLSKSMLKNPIEVRVEDENLDFAGAKRIADQKAADISKDPMLLAWFDKKYERFSPLVECCGDDKPAWLVYAESRGGTIVIDINGEEYVFVYREG